MNYIQVNENRGRAIALIIVIGFCVAVLTACSIRIDPDGNRTKRSGGKVLVCHKGKKTLSIADAAVKAHLRHGDQLGACR